MNLTGQQIKDTYEGLLNIGATGLTGSLQAVTDGLGNIIPMEVSDTTINFTGTVTGLPVVNSSPITVEQTNSLVSTAIGATATGNNAVSIGTSSVAGNCVVAIGFNAQGDGTGAIAIGQSTYAENPSIAIGRTTRANGAWNIALGFGLNNGCYNTTTDSILIGCTSVICSGTSKGISIGTDNTIYGDSCKSMSIGSGNGIFPGATGAIVLGNSSVGGTGSCDSVIIGNSVSTPTPKSVLIGGNSNQITGGSRNTILNGCNNTINGGTDSLIIGSDNISGCTQNLIVGRNNNIQGGQLRESGCLANYVFGCGNSISDPYTAGSLIAGRNNTNGGYLSLIAGESNTANYTYNGLIVGAGNTMATEFAYVLGQANYSNSQGSFTTGRYNCNTGYAIAYENQFIHGCYNRTMMAMNTAILGGTYNEINGVMYDSAGRPQNDGIIGGNHNCIGLYAYDSVIIGGTGNNIPAAVSATGAFGNVVMLGTKNRTATSVDTTYVENLVAFGQAAALAHTVGTTGGTVTLDWNNSNSQFITLDSSISSLTKSNPIDGGVYTVFITQAGSGSYTINWGTEIKWPGGTPPTLSTAVGATDAVTLIYYAGITGYYGNANLNFV